MSSPREKKLFFILFPFGTAFAVAIRVRPSMAAPLRPKRGFSQIWERWSATAYSSIIAKINTPAAAIGKYSGFLMIGNFPVEGFPFLGIPLFIVD